MIPTTPGANAAPPKVRMLLPMRMLLNADAKIAKDAKIANERQSFFVFFASFAFLRDLRV